MMRKILCDYFISFHGQLKSIWMLLVLFLLVCVSAQESHAGTVSVSPSSLIIGQSTTAKWSGFTSNVNVKVYKGGTEWVDSITDQPGTGSQVLDTTGWDEPRSDYRVGIELRVSPFTITYSNYYHYRHGINTSR